MSQFVSVALAGLAVGIIFIIASFVVDYLADKKEEEDENNPI